MEKSASEFSQRSGKYKGLASYCKPCIVIRSQSWYNRNGLRKGTRSNKVSKMNSIFRMIHDIYNTQRGSSRKRGHALPKYSSEELMSWACGQEKLYSLYQNWISSGKVKDLKPSIDRLNDETGYSFENIQLVTWRQNLMNQAEKKSRAIVLQNKKSGEIFKFPSIRSASIEMDLHQPNLVSCCKGHRKSVAGFLASYDLEA